MGCWSVFKGGWEVGYVVELSGCLGRFLNRRLYLVVGFVLMGTNLLAV